MLKVTRYSFKNGKNTVTSSEHSLNYYWTNQGQKKYYQRQKSHRNIFSSFSCFTYTRNIYKQRQKLPGNTLFWRTSIENRKMWLAVTDNNLQPSQQQANSVSTHQPHPIIIFSEWKKINMKCILTLHWKIHKQKRHINQILQIQMSPLCNFVLNSTQNEMGLLLKLDHPFQHWYKGQKNIVWNSFLFLPNNVINDNRPIHFPSLHAWGLITFTASSKLNSRHAF